MQMIHIEINSELLFLWFIWSFAQHNLIALSSFGSLSLIDEVIRLFARNFVFIYKLFGATLNLILIEWVHFIAMVHTVYDNNGKWKIVAIHLRSDPCDLFFQSVCSWKQSKSINWPNFLSSVWMKEDEKKMFWNKLK